MILVSTWPTVIGVLPGSPVHKNEYCINIVAYKFVMAATLVKEGIGIKF